ncbi:hypothetical protein AFE02nite_05120 [Actinotalea fermentans]|uniref:Uncharacterized protein n=1 Tax=Actinotalea fermentans TaxID=43671 RepID=A0A511YUA6_9CELL|nr:hypothetical protein AFE02nite_05120 [Actinotalea fermentans]
MARDGGMVAIGSLRELAELLGLLGAPAYVRFSGGPEADAAGTSVDKESGCTLPGLSVNPLTPEPWWDRPAEHWLARQLCQYAHLGGGERFGWVLTGDVVGRGPDSEPLVREFRAVARLASGVLDEAERVYAAVFDPGRV